MTLFEDLKPGTRLRGLAPIGIAEIVQVSCFGADAVNLIFRADGRIGERLVYRGEETGFDVVEPGRSYAFDAVTRRSTPCSMRSSWRSSGRPVLR